MIWTPKDIRNHNAYTMTKDGEWIPARPSYQIDRWRDRIRWGWGVFIGKYDALDWEEQS